MSIQPIQSGASEQRGARRRKPTSALQAAMSFITLAPDTTIPVMLKDISTGGCRLSAPCALPLDGIVSVAIPASETDPAIQLQAKIIVCEWDSNAWGCRLRFAGNTREALGQLARILNGGNFVRLEAGTPRRSLDEWAAHLVVQTLPVRAQSRAAILAAAQSEAIADIPASAFRSAAQADPFLSLVFFWTGIRSQTPSVLAAILSLPPESRYQLVMSSPEVAESQGLLLCLDRLAGAGPTELLAATGELLLWHFAPELPLAALEAQLSQPELSAEDSQRQACGFAFHELSEQLSPDRLLSRSGPQA